MRPGKGAFNVLGHRGDHGRRKLGAQTLCRRRMFSEYHALKQPQDRDAGRLCGRDELWRHALDVKLRRLGTPNTHLIAEVGEHFGLARGPSLVRPLPGSGEGAGVNAGKSRGRLLK
jgi:hypothetical protein